jgi:chromosome segregation ATPase
MPVRFGNYTKILITICLILTVGLLQGEAQTRKKKRTRRTAKPAPARPVITNPTIAPATTTGATTATTGASPNATTGDVKIISESSQNTESGEQLQGWKPKATAPEQQPSAPASEGSQRSNTEMQDTINNLSNQVNRLNDKLTQMQEDDRYQLDMERLTRAEQRAEQLRMQLVDVQSKIADLEAKLEQLEYALKPENIDRATQGYGTVHPEEAREARRKQLESEKGRVQAQLKILNTSQNRLEVSVANADNEVDLLRAKLEQRRNQMDAAPPTPKTSTNPRKPQ